jgi:HD-GYP domain-containing protein (c-di-GMP phosphodiesterase class II)
MVTIKPHDARPLYKALTYTWQMLQGQPLTFCHSCRVALIMLRLGNALGLHDQILAQLYLAGVLHDIGKKYFQDLVLKPGAFTARERKKMEQHPAFSWQLSQDLDLPQALREAILKIVRGHHEKVSGEGYPDRLKGAAVTLPLRIATVADMYDAMRERRTYRDSLTSDATTRLLSERHLSVEAPDIDADVFEALMSIQLKDLDHICTTTDPQDCCDMVFGEVPGYLVASAA